MRFLELAALIAWLLILPLVLAGGAYALMWSVLAAVRYIPIIGRKHRHQRWEGLNRGGPTLPLE